MQRSKSLKPRRSTIINHEEFQPKQEILKLLENNKNYIDEMKLLNPDHFTELSKIQKPDYLFIGCADSRVPANEIMGLKSGEVFVHRNIANLVIQSDFNCLSVVQYAIDHLEIQQVLIVGHYGCGGVRASMLEQNDLGLFQNWTKNIKDLNVFYADELQDLSDDDKHDRLCEYNVAWQVKNLCQTTVIQSAWQRGKVVNVHGLIYDLKDGILQDMGVHIDSMKKFEEFQNDLWKKRFHPKAQDLIEKIAEDIRSQARRNSVFLTKDIKPTEQIVSYLDYDHDSEEIQSSDDEETIQKKVLKKIERTNKRDSSFSPAEQTQPADSQLAQFQ